MKQILKKFPLLAFLALPAGFLFFCSWQVPNADSNFKGINIHKNDTTPKELYKEQHLSLDDLDKTINDLDINMSELNEQMKNISINIDAQIEESLSAIDFDKIKAETEASLKQVDFTKAQQQLAEAQKEIAKIDLVKVQNELNEMQEKFKSDDFKNKINSEKLQKDISEAMENAKAGMAKAKEHLQRLKEFTTELEKDGLINRSKGYSIEWKDGSLFLNNVEQSKAVSDKYRRYEKDFHGKIKMLPEGAERF